MFSFETKKMVLPQPQNALPGRDKATPVPAKHHVLGTSLTEFPAGTAKALFGMGCFWGAERLYWQQAGIYTTAVGYSAGFTPNPTYEEVCSGMTGHNEVVLVVYWPEQVQFAELLRLFWENHNPTQGMCQANDRGTQYRSGIYYFNQDQRNQADASRAAYQERLHERSAGTVTTEVAAATEFYYAEAYHQQYLAKNPGGYCNLQTLAKSGLPALGEL